MSCSAVICIGVGQGLAVVLENVADGGQSWFTS
jgi:hypothetical protein